MCIYFKFGPVVQKAMAFFSFSTFSSLLIRFSGVNCAILVEGMILIFVRNHLSQDLTEGTFWQ